MVRGGVVAEEIISGFSARPQGGCGFSDPLLLFCFAEMLRQPHRTSPLASRFFQKIPV